MKKIVEFISKLLEESQSLIKLSREYGESIDKKNHSQTRDEYTEKLSRWFRSINQVLSYGELNEYLKTINYILRKQPRLVPSDEVAFVSGILKSAHECLLQGFIDKLKYVIHGEMFNSFFEQAESLLNSGHKISSAVLGRIVIE
jgi:hypothetical protein